MGKYEDLEKRVTELEELNMALLSELYIIEQGMEEQIKEIYELITEKNNIDFAGDDLPEDFVEVFE